SRSGARAPQTLRAIWSPDVEACKKGSPATHNPFALALSPRNRRELVYLTGSIDDDDGAHPKKIEDRLGRVIDCEQLSLSALGASMRVQYAQEQPKKDAGGDISLEEWKQETVVGRDQYVKISEKGFLYPWGHRVSLIKLTEREFRPAG